MKFRRSLGAVTLVAWFFSGATADVFMKQVHTTEGLGGKGAETDTMSIWASEKAMQSTGSEQTVLVSLDKEVVFMIDNAKKEYTVLPFSVFEEASRKSEEMKENEDIPPQFKDMMTMKVSVRPTDETKTINGYSCRKYVQTVQNPMMNMKADLWATEEIEIDPRLFQSYYSAFSGGNTQMSDMLGQMYEEFSKIQGIVVYSESVSKVMGREMKSTTELIDAKEEDPPNGTYEVPEGYRKKG